MSLRKILLGLALAVLGGLGAQSALAAPLGFATDTGSDLYSVDFGAGTATLIGNTGQFFESVALAANGTLYGATNGGELYSINTATGASTLIGDTGLGNIEGLDFNGGTLLATDFTSTPSVYSLNLATGTPTFVATADANTGSVRSMTVLSPTPIGDTGSQFWLSLTAADNGRGIPLPGTLWLVAVGLAGLGLQRRKR